VTKTVFWICAKTYTYLIMKRMFNSCNNTCMTNNFNGLVDLTFLKVNWGFQRVHQFPEITSCGWDCCTKWFLQLDCINLKTSAHKESHLCNVKQLTGTQVKPSWIWSTEDYRKDYFSPSSCIHIFEVKILEKIYFTPQPMKMNFLPTELSKTGQITP
jgi:hypothetical protein